MKKNKKWYWIFALLLCLVLSPLNIYATVQLDNPEIQYKSDEEIKSRLVTTVTIENPTTGEIRRYEVEDDKIDIYRQSETGEITVVANVGEDQNIYTRAQSQTSSNTIYGWKGNVRITFVDNFDGDERGTACLKSAGGDWTQVSGNYEMTDKKITYGQMLLTNSMSETAYFSNSYNISLMWPLGNYLTNIGCELGANISGYVNGEYVRVACNYKFI